MVKSMVVRGEGEREVGGTRYLVNEPSVISEVIDGETIVLNFDSGHYFSLNSVASAIWGHLAHGGTVKPLVAMLTARYGLEPGSMNDVVTGFVARLETEGLVRRAMNGPSADGEPDLEGALGGEFLLPDFEKFTDMEQLLLLDPIHEVTDAGWPHGRKP